MVSADDKYLNELSGISEDSFIMPSDPKEFFPWGFGLKLGSKRNVIAARLAELGIETWPGFSSASQLPYISEALIADDGAITHSDKLSEEALLLPHYPDLTNKTITEICTIILAEILLI